MSDRLIGIAFLPHVRERATYRETYDDSSVQHGLEEALACRDMLASAPLKTSPLRRVAAWVKAVARALRGREAPRRRPVTADVAHVTTTH